MINDFRNVLILECGHFLAKSLQIKLQMFQDYSKGVEIGEVFRHQNIVDFDDSIALDFSQDYKFSKCSES